MWMCEQNVFLLNELKFGYATKYMQLQQFQCKEYVAVNWCKWDCAWICVPFPFEVFNSNCVLRYPKTKTANWDHCRGTQRSTSKDIATIATTVWTMFSCLIPTLVFRQIPSFLIIKVGHQVTIFFSSALLGPKEILQLLRDLSFDGSVQRMHTPWWKKKSKCWCGCGMWTQLAACPSKKHTW